MAGQAKIRSLQTSVAIARIGADRSSADAMRPILPTAPGSARRKASKITASSIPPSVIVAPFVIAVWGELRIGPVRGQAHPDCYCDVDFVRDAARG